MYSPTTLNSPAHISPATISKTPNKTISKSTISLNLFNPLSQSSFYTKPISKRAHFHHKLYKNRNFIQKNRVSSDDVQSSVSFEGKEPSFVEFITSERVKVVAMVGLALALCNADRVVMSVAIVPLSLSRGWSQSFAGVVQVLFVCYCLCHIGCRLEC